MFLGFVLLSLTGCTTNKTGDVGVGSERSQVTTVSSTQTRRMDKATRESRRAEKEQKEEDEKRVKREKKAEEVALKEKEKEKAKEKAKTKESPVTKGDNSGVVFVPNPLDTEDDEVRYESYGEGSFSAQLPDYKQYSSVDVISLLGQPDMTISDREVLSQRLEEDEWELILAEVKAGHLTENQGKAFMIQSVDISAAASMGGNIVGLIYEEQGKPNVYLIDDEVAYLTPLTTYIDFTGKL